jgi:hypothetical protein
MKYTKPVDTLSFDVEQHARQRWWHEEDLIRDRITWLLTSHGVIGAGYAWLKHRSAELVVEVARAGKDDALRASLEAYRVRIDDLSLGLWWIGIVVSIFVLFGVGAAVAAQYQLRKQYDGADFKLGVSSVTTWLGQAVALALPALCLVGWKIARDVLP